ncbi:MAG: hypothetical protein Q4G09_03055 [Clostridia bacterium]|nr:hypothetical protein [Clostridia bacterium]
MKKTFKWLFAVVFLFVLLLCLTGCGDKENTENAGSNNQGENQQQQAQKGNDTGVSDTLAWPDNDFTKQVPKPKQSFKEAAFGDSVTCYTYPNWTVEEAREYTEELKENGFTISSNLINEDDDYMVILKNSDGSYQVTVSSEGTSGGLIIAIPMDRR